MTLKEYFENINLNDIEEFVEKQIPEDLYLDFKTANFPSGSNFDNKNFSKCLSGFSNSLGGILIWGIKASKNKNGVDAAKDLKPIKGLLKFENHLKRIEGKSVVPLIEGIEYRRIEESEDKGYLLVYIPQSERAPHMAQFAEKHYFKRSGDSFYICEHFDIMDMLNRKTTPKLQIEIQNENITKEETYDQVKYKYHSIFSIKNVGQVSAKHLVVFIKVHKPFQLSHYGIDGNGNIGMKRIPTNETYTKYIGGNELVLHPGTYHEVNKIVLNEIGLDEKIGDLTIEYKIIAEGMKLMIGEIKIKKEELIEK
jgi:hypothetical protein